MSNFIEAEIDAEAIPGKFAERAQWICWRAEERDGKATKVPVDPATGSFASTIGRGPTSREHSTVHRLTLQMGSASCSRQWTHSSVWTWTTVEINSDEPLEPAREIIQRLDSFIEVSPSGTGYHVILEG